MYRFSRIKSACRWFSESEQAKSKIAVPPLPNESTIFDKIVRGEIKANVVFEDERVLAFRDIAPRAPTHIILIPKQRDGLINLMAAEERHTEILGYLLIKAAEIAKQEKLDEGWRLVINNGKNACQSVYHLHLHILGGRELNWPPG